MTAPGSPVQRREAHARHTESDFLQNARDTTSESEDGADVGLFRLRGCADRLKGRINRVRAISRFRRAERGSVSAEFAIGLPGVVAIILLALGALVAGATQIECQEAARVGAREAMLAGGTGSAAAAAQKVVGSRAEISVSGDGSWITVSVSKPLFAAGFPIRVSATMMAPVEGRGE